MTPNQRIPIGEYGLIGDTRTAALVAPDGSIDWLCLPRFDSPPIFGRLVGGAEAGYFVIGPDEPATLAGRRYRRDTATLETEWAVDGGRLVLADTMVGEVTGSMLPETLLVRRITSQGRPIRVRVEFALRFGYDREPARRTRHRNGFLLVEHGDLAIALTTNSEEQLTPDRPNLLAVGPNRPVTTARLPATPAGSGPDPTATDAFASALL